MNIQSNTTVSCQEKPKFQEQLQVAGFVLKTYEMLYNQQFQKIIFWAQNGTEFVVKDVIKFEEIVLPRYFRHNKINSFVRQLNMYGFHKIKHNNFRSIFRHQFFRKDRKQLLPMIKRRLKFCDKQNEEILEENTTTIQTNPEQSISTLVKQEEPTMTQQKWANISHQFLGTTKMINMSLVRIDPFIAEESECECVSIQNQLEAVQKREQFLYQFQDPACFFASKFDL